MSSAYHPQTDGQTEVINRCLETYLRCFSSEQPRTWTHWLRCAELWYNTTFHAFTGSTPFEIVYGQPLPTLLHFIEGETKVEAVARELKDRDEALRQLINQKLAPKFFGRYKIMEKIGGVTNFNYFLHLESIWSFMFHN